MRSDLTAAALTLEADATRSAAAGSTNATRDWLRASSITKRYGSHTVLDGIDLAIDRGSFVVLAGRNGAGKSTLLGCLAGVVRHAGEVQLDGRSIGRATQGRLSYLPQRLRFPATLTGREVISLFESLGSGGTASAGQRPRAATEVVGVGFLPPLDQPIGQLSGGQAQRVALAAALAGGPDLVLLDEPFANLDDAGRDAARVALRSACDAGATVVVASPSALDLLSTAGRVVLIEDGRIAFDGPPGVYESRLEVVIRVRSGDVDLARLAAIPHVLAAHPEGEWIALACHEDRSVELLRALDALGIVGDRVRLGGPSADPRHSTSPDRIEGRP